MANMAVTIINETSVSLNNKAITETLKLILRRLNHPVRVTIELLIVGDDKITALNNQYRQTNQPTDVLSFPHGSEAKDDQELAGSIVISADTAKKQAQQAGITVEKEINTLAGHGFLHLLGYHHQ